MKKKLIIRILFLLPVFLFLFPPTGISGPYTNLFREYQPDHTPGGWMVSAHSIFSYVDYQNQPGDLSVKFPYLLTNRSNGTSSNAVFSSNASNLTGTGKWVYPGIGIEAGKENFSVEGIMGIYYRQWSDHLYFGINYRFILKKIHADPERYTFGSTSVPGRYGENIMGDFPVKISCGIFYWQPIWELGNIDIGDKEFFALGHIMQSRDSLIAPGNGSVTVLYHQNYVALTPNINIGYRPQNGRLDISFRISPMITIKEYGGLRFVMRNSGNVEWAPTNGISVESVIPLDTAGMDARFNGENIESTPFRLKCVMYSFRIGFRII